MPCYIISYDLDLRGTRNYESLYEGIKSYGTWAHITQSTWAIVTDAPAEAVRDNLLSFIDGNDRLFVVKSGTAAAWRNVICNNEWLKKYL